MIQGAKDKLANVSTTTKVLVGANVATTAAIMAVDMYNNPASLATRLVATIGTSAAVAAVEAAAYYGSAVVNRESAAKALTFGLDTVKAGYSMLPSMPKFGFGQAAAPAVVAQQEEAAAAPVKRKRLTEVERLTRK